MAVIAPVVVDVSPAGDQSAWQVTWTASAGDTCRPVSYPKHNDKSIQLAAGGGIAGSTITLVGSNDRSNFIGLRDPTSTAISLTAADLKAVLENTVEVKPVITGGAAVSVVITMLFHFGNPNRT